MTWLTRALSRLSCLGGSGRVTEDCDGKEVRSKHSIRIVHAVVRFCTQADTSWRLQAPSTVAQPAVDEYAAQVANKGKPKCLVGLCSLVIDRKYDA